MLEKLGAFDVAKKKVPFCASSVHSTLPPTLKSGGAGGGHVASDLLKGLFFCTTRTPIRAKNLAREVPGNPPTARHTTDVEGAPQCTTALFTTHCLDRRSELWRLSRCTWRRPGLRDTHLEDFTPTPNTYQEGDGRKWRQPSYTTIKCGTLYYTWVATGDWLPGWLAGRLAGSLAGKQVH